MSSIAFDGLSDKNGSAMCFLLMHRTPEEYGTFYTKHQKAIQKSVFKDSLVLQKTWKILAEHMCCVHKNVIFLVRNHLEGSEQVFRHIKCVYDRSAGQKEEMYVYRIIKEQDGPEWRRFFETMLVKIILPYLYKLHIYSPVLSFLLFLHLVHGVLDMYLDCSLKHHSKSLISEYKDILSVIHADFTHAREKGGTGYPFSFVHPILRSSILDEINTHKNILGMI